MLHHQRYGISDLVFTNTVNSFFFFSNKVWFCIYLFKFGSSNQNDEHIRSNAFNRKNTKQIVRTQYFLSLTKKKKINFDVSQCANDEKSTEPQSSSIQNFGPKRVPNWKNELEIEWLTTLSFSHFKYIGCHW